MIDTYEFDAAAFADDLLTCGLSGSELARRAGCANSHVTQCACGATPSTQRYLALCAAAELAPAHFIGVDDVEPGAYELDTLALYEAANARDLAGYYQLQNWRNGTAKFTHMQTFTRICQRLGVSPVTFFSRLT